MFALPFIGVGVGTLVHAGRCWRTHGAARSWQAVPAAIKSVEFESHSNGDSITYSVEAVYEYEFGGESYTESRVAIMGGSSNDYEIHRRRYEELKRQHDAGEPFHAYVNPDDPSQAVLFRESDPWMYALIPFGIVFLAGGLVVLGLGVWGLREYERLEEVEELTPGEPWRVREDWSRGEVKASNLKEIAFFWIFGLWLTVFLSVFVILMGSEGAPLPAWLFIGLFGVVALWMLGRAFLMTLRQLVHGSPALYLEEVPVQPGGRTSAAVRTAKPFKAGRWALELRCYMPAREGTDERARAEELFRNAEQTAEGGPTFRAASWRGWCIYRRELEPAGEAKADRTGAALLPVVIEVPEGAPATSVEPTECITWTLLVKAKSFPWGFSAEFDLPVFQPVEPPAAASEAAS